MRCMASFGVLVRSTQSGLIIFTRIPTVNGVRMFLHYGDLMDTGNIEKLVNQIKPDEIYNLDQYLLKNLLHLVIEFKV